MKTLAIVVTAPQTARLFVIGLAQHVAAKGVDVHIICGPGLDIGTIHENVHVHSIPVHRDPKFAKDLKALILLLMTLRKINPDTLTYATPKAALLASMAGWLLRIPKRVYQLWGLRLETANGLQLRILRLSERITSLLSTSVIANSKSLAAEYRRRRLAGRHVVDTIGDGSSHGVDIDHFDVNAERPALPSFVEEFLADPSQLVLGYVGRLHPDKGIDAIYQALELCEEIGVRVKFVVVGESEGLRARPMRNVLHVGPTNDVRPFLASIDLLVLMSRREGFPNVVLEAAAMQVPAIVSCATGVVDSVEDGFTGIVIPVDAPQALADEIQRLSRDRAFLMQMGRQARARVVAKYDSRIVHQRYAEYLGGVVE